MALTWDWVGFWALAIITIGAALMVVRTTKLIHSAIWLAVVLGGVAGFFLFLGSEFVAGVQVLIYIGAILTLILFSIMFTGEDELEAHE